MTALTVIGCIILFFAVLLLSPIILSFSYRDGKMSGKVRVIFLTIDFSPEKAAKRAEKKAEKAVKNEYKKQKAEEETPQKEKKAAADTVKTIESLVNASKKGLDILRRHLIFYRIRSTIIVGGTDAAAIAKSYAAYCTAVSNGLALLDSVFMVTEPDVYIAPDFLREKTMLELAFKVRIAPWFLLCAGASVLLRFMKVTRENKRKREKIKGGNNDERNERSKQRERAASYK